MTITTPKMSQAIDSYRFSRNVQENV